MLKITIPGKEMFNEETQEFFETKSYTIQLEHSLVSVSNGNQNGINHFLVNRKKRQKKQLTIYDVTITQNIDPVVYNGLTNDNVKVINKYIDAPMTATTFSDGKGKINNDIITSELIYYWMTALSIPMECQRWHLNRLLTLIRVCNVKNNPPKKMSKRELMQRNASLNAARRAQFNTKRLNGYW